MQKHSEDFYIAAIKSVYPQSWNIRRPVISGYVAEVFFADTPNGTVVCKFNDKDIIQRNYQISQLTQLNKIPVPYTCKHAYFDTYFESYPYYSGDTLFEHIQQGATNSQIFDVYKQAIEVQAEISKIKPGELDFDWGKHSHETFIKNKAVVAGPIKTFVLGCLFKMFSRSGQQFLLHNDMQTKNILVDNDLKLTGVIDLDSVALCNEDFSVLKTLYSYPLNNYAEYIEAYQDIVGRKLNRDAILNGVQTLRNLRDCAHKMRKSRQR